jgi:uncharacterized lipoprotein YmbA
LLTPQADPTRFYVLSTPPSASAATQDGDLKRWRIGLSPVEVAVYLRRKEMVVRTGSNEVHFAEYHRWAESLDQGIGRAMKESLGSAANVQSVVVNSRGGTAVDYVVSVRILACEGVRVGDGAGSTGFAAVWSIRAAGTNLPAAKSGSYTAGPAPWDGRDYGRLAGRLSEAVAAASRAVAADLPAEHGAAVAPGVEQSRE